MVAGWHQYMWSSNTSIKYRCSMSVEPCWGHGTVFFLFQRNVLLCVCVVRYLKHLQALSHMDSHSVAVIEQQKKPKSRTLLISFRLVTRSQTALSHRSPAGPVMRWMLTHTKLPAGLIFHCPVIACGEIKARIIEKKFVHGFQQCLKIPSVTFPSSRVGRFWRLVSLNFKFLKDKKVIRE